MMLRTRLPGRPEDFHAVDAFMADRVTPAATEFADAVVGERIALALAFASEAGELFGLRAKELARAADGFAEVAKSAGRHVAALGVALRTSNQQLLRIRTEAQLAGLTLTDDGVLPPASGDPALVAAWDKAVAEYEEVVTDWRIAFEGTAEASRGVSAELINLTMNLMSVGASEALHLHSSRWAEIAKGHLADAQRSRDHVAALTSAGRYPAQHAGHLYGLIDEALDSDRAAAAADAKSKLPRGVRVGVGGLGALALAHGLYADRQSGESLAQAAASQGAALGAATAVARLASVIPHPGVRVGTALLGAALAGATTDAGVDAAWDAWGQQEQLAQRREAEVLAKLRDRHGVSARELRLDPDRIKQAEGRLLTIAEDFEEAADKPAPGDFGTAGALVLLILSAVSESAAKLVTEAALLALGLSMAREDMTAADAESALELVRLGGGLS
ncbi:hypothetical protein [Nocardioides limicola]|uniref:hypothetical protein n=1 Tax=Nocardioides limicola TaxID=2803368 RepID=UPI00193B6817|nr:hypothetical protein [Nocardioides sp. DJM-14]